MIKLNLFDYDDNSSHTFEFKSIEEVKETYSLTDEEVSSFLSKKESIKKLLIKILFLEKIK